MIIKSYVHRSCLPFAVTLRSSISPLFLPWFRSANVQFKIADNEDGRNKGRRDCLVISEISDSLQQQTTIIAEIRDETVRNSFRRYFMVYKMICECYHTYRSTELRCYLVRFIHWSLCLSKDRPVASSKTNPPHTAI